MADLLSHPFLNTASWWMIGFVGLLVPYLILGLILFLVFWLFVKPKLAWIPALALLIGFQQLSVVFAWKPGPSVSENKPERVLRVVSWNIQSFNGNNKSRTVKQLARTELAESIQRLNADVVCLQEFNHTDGYNSESDNLSLFKKHIPIISFQKIISETVVTINRAVSFFQNIPSFIRTKSNFR